MRYETQGNATTVQNTLITLCFISYLRTATDMICFLCILKVARVMHLQRSSCLDIDKQLFLFHLTLLLLGEVTLFRRYTSHCCAVKGIIFIIIDAV